MIFSLLISSHPTHPNSTCALAFAHAIRQQGHRLLRVFFVGPAVTLAAPEAAPELSRRWLELANQSSAELSVCITDFNEYHPEYENVALTGFILSGMGQLADASQHSDRLITFR